MCHTNSIAKVRRAFSMVGMLITMVCMVVLFVILMNSANTAVTGQKTQQAGTVDSFKDKLYLTAIVQSMMVNATENNGSFLIPGRLGKQNDPTQDTTANLFSAMVMDHFTPANQLISGNEYSGYVREKTNYNYNAYNPVTRVFWDPTFVADLKKDSNVSFAHLPLMGKRFEKNWRMGSLDSRFPIIGNRGPKDGINSPNSYACGRDGVWRGHIVFGDGHIEFTENPVPNGLTFMEDGYQVQDNVFAMEDGPHGADAIISFTRTMSTSGPELQFD
jgi:hypothetical protein